METIDQLAGELDLIADKVDRLKNAPQEVLKIADSIDDKDYQVIQDTIIQLQQVQRTINGVFVILNLVREAVTNGRVILERATGSKRVGPP